MRWARHEAPVALVGPLSGSRSAHASLLHRAAAYLQTQGQAFVLLDDQAQPETAWQVARHLLALQPAAVIGHFNSACASVALPLYRRHGLALLLPTASHDGLTASGGAFRLCARDSQQATLMLHYIARLRLAPHQVELVSDHSPYAQRLQRVLLAHSGALRWNPADAQDMPQAGCRLRLVLATCAKALQIAARLQGWQGQALYADDAHIEAFAARAAPRHTLVAAPAPDYEQTIQQACELVLQARRAGASDLRQWLSNCGHFDAEGNARNAGWRILQLRSGAYWQAESGSQREALRAQHSPMQ